MPPRTSQRRRRAIKFTPAAFASLRREAKDGQRAAWGLKLLQSPRATMKSTEADATPSRAIAACVEIKVRGAFHGHYVAEK